MDIGGFENLKKEELVNRQVAQKELIENMRITDSNSDHDTLTVTQALVQDP